jgi:tetratricopeptide (TPR) repeat protein
MAEDFTIDNSELEALFRKYESAPDSYVFAPLADAYRKAGMLDEAVEICRKGIRKHARYPSGHVVLGKCYFDLGEVDEAEDSFQSVLGLDENNLVALKYLGMIQAGRGELEVARERFKHILVLDPENREIRHMLEDLQEVEESVPTDDDKAADEEFEGEPISLGSDTSETSDDLATTTLADIYAAQGYLDKAAKIYGEILRQQPDNAEVRRKLLDIDGGGEFPEIGDTEPIDTLGTRPGSDGVEAGEVEQEPLPPVESDSFDRAEEDSETIDLSPERSREPAEEVGEAAPTPPGGTGRSLDDQKSYDQFKRWLKNLQDE